MWAPENLLVRGSDRVCLLAITQRLQHHKPELFFKNFQQQNQAGKKPKRDSELSFQQHIEKELQRLAAAPASEYEVKLHIHMHNALHACTVQMRQHNLWRLASTPLSEYEVESFLVHLVVGDTSEGDCRWSNFECMASCLLCLIL